MKTEIEKMYEYVGLLYCNKCRHDSELDCLYMCENKYPPFTAEKQLELIKLIANRKGYPDYEYFGNLFDDYIQLLDFNEALANLINNLWQNLAEQEKGEIRRILE